LPEMPDVGELGVNREDRCLRDHDQRSILAPLRPSVDFAQRACEDDTSVVDLKFLRICSELRIGTSNPKTTLES
jgi:hypothetical protein